MKILEQADKGDQTITEICREHGISQATFYSWRKQFRGMNVEKTLREFKHLRWMRQHMVTHPQTFQRSRSS
ncbi:transposase [Candidatus Bipolaricaulota bacterium]|nr:transposase [Candidatus Bipolaricaulota bacterium]